MFYLHCVQAIRLITEVFEVFSTAATFAKQKQTNKQGSLIIWKSKLLTIPRIN